MKSKNAITEEPSRINPTLLARVIDDFEWKLENFFQEDGIKKVVNCGISVIKIDRVLFF